MHTVEDVLAELAQEVVWIGPLESVYEAARKMKEHHVGALLVQIEDTLVGIVSERDYVRKVILDYKTSQQTKVSEIMSQDVVKVAPSDTIDECIDLMRHHHIRHLPVVDRGRPVGIISLRDLFLEVIEEARTARGG